jgi:ribosome-associated protein
MSALKISTKISIPDSEFDLHFSRSSGPGGQNVNKVNSKVVMYWPIADSSTVPQEVKDRFAAKFSHRMTQEHIVIITSDKYRDQKRNVEDCLEKLKEMLVEVLVPPKKRRATKPSKSSVQKRLSGKKADSDRKKLRKKIDY